MSLHKCEKENEKLLEPLHNDFNKTDLCMPVGECVGLVSEIMSPDAPSRLRIITTPRKPSAAVRQGMGRPELTWLTLKCWFEKTLNGWRPLGSSCTIQTLRFSRSGLPSVSKVKTKCTPHIWKKLPEILRCTANHSPFKWKLKSFLFCTWFC